jgi:hypothetical protein
VLETVLKPTQVGAPRLAVALVTMLPIIVAITIYAIYRLCKYALVMLRRKPTATEMYVAAAAELQLKHELVIDNDIVVDDVIDKVTKRVSKKPLFRSYLVQMAKGKFGTPKRTKANTMAVRKFMVDLCLEHGIVARHITANVDIATALVFVYSKEELLAKAIARTELTQMRASVAQELDEDEEANNLP